MKIIRFCKIYSFSLFSLFATGQVEVAKAFAASRGNECNYIPWDPYKLLLGVVCELELNLDGAHWIVGRLM